MDDYGLRRLFMSRDRLSAENAALRDALAELSRAADGIGCGCLMTRARLCDSCQEDLVAALKAARDLLGGSV